MRHTQREAETQAEGEAGSMPEAQRGLDPGTPGSCPGPKAGTNLLSHPGIPTTLFLNFILIITAIKICVAIFKKSPVKDNAKVR